MAAFEAVATDGSTMGATLRSRPVWVTALLTVSAVAVAAVLVARSDDQGEPVARPLSPAVAGLLAQEGTVDRGVRVVAAAPLRERTAHFWGSGHVVSAWGDRAVSLPAVPDLGRLVVAQDEAGRVTGAAVQVPLAGRTGGPVVVDYVETAFARLVTLPPYAVADPRELLILRGLAEESPHLRGLAQRMEEHARRAPDSFWRESDPEEARELAALAGDLALELIRLAEVTGVQPAGWSAPSAGGPPAQGPVVSVQSASWPPSGGIRADSDINAGPRDYHACQPKDVDDNWTDPPINPGTTTGVCVFPHANGDGSFEVGLVNHGPSWAFLYSGQPGELASLPLAAVRPHTREWPSLQELATSLGKDMASAVPRTALSLACKGMAYLSSWNCSPNLEVVDLPSLFTSTKNRVEGASQLGKVSFHLDAESARHPLGLSTGGSIQVEDIVPEGLPADQLTSTTGLALVSSLVTQLFVPAVALVTGTSAGRHAKPGGPSIDIDGLPGKHRGDVSYRKELYGPLLQAYARLAGNGEFVKALADVRSGDLTQALPGVAALVAQIMASPEFLTAVLALTVPNALEWFAASLVELRDLVALAAVPGVGWIKAAWEGSERAIKGAGLAYGAWRFLDDLPKIADTHWWPPLVQPPPPPEQPPPPDQPPPQQPLPTPNWNDVVRLDCSDAIGGPLVEVAAEADITGDGVGEVFLVSECGASTSSWPQVLSVYDISGTTGPARLQTLLDYDDGVDGRGLRDIQVLDVTGESLMVGALAFLDEDGNCCPSQDVVVQYEWDGASYILTARDFSETGTGD